MIVAHQRPEVCILSRLNGWPVLCWDRARARRLSGGGFPAPPFRLRGGFTIPPWPRFPRPPYNPGRPVFPGPVRNLGLSSVGLPSLARFKRWFAYAPTSVVCPQPRSTSYVGLSPALCPATALTDETAKCPESLCPMSVLPRSGRRVPSPRRTLLLRLRSYGLMRQSRLALPYFSLSLVRGVFAGCYQPLLPPGSSRRYLCESFLGCLVPYHGGPTECMCLFLPLCHRPSPTGVWVGFPLLSANTTFHGAYLSRLQTFLYVQASKFAHLPDRSYRYAILRRAAEAFYIRADRASLPPHASDMLAVRIQAIDGTGTFTQPDSQPCRLLPPVYASLRPSRQERKTRDRCRLLASHRMTLAFTTPHRLVAGAPELNTQPTYTPVYASLYTSRCTTQNSGPSGSLILSRKNFAFSASCRFIPAHRHGLFATSIFGQPTSGFLVIRILNFGHSPLPYLCRTLVKRLRLFPVERIDILGSGIAKQQW